MAEKHLQEPDSGIVSGVSDNLHSPMQVSDSDENEQLRSRIKELEKEVKMKDDQIRQLKSQLGKAFKEKGRQAKELESKKSEIDQLISEKQQLKSQLENLHMEKGQLVSEQSETRRVLGVLLKSSPRSMIVFLLELTAHKYKMERRKAYGWLQDLYRVAEVRGRALPSFDDLEALRQRLSSWYSENPPPPCFIHTMCVWYERTCPEVPFHYYSFLPDVHREVNEDFVKENFFIVAEGSEKKDIPQLYEDRYVLCYKTSKPVGHMCVVSKKELGAIKSGNAQGLKCDDLELQGDLEQKNITNFLLCLPRGDMSSTDGYYKIAEVRPLQNLNCLQLNEPTYQVKITVDGSTHYFEWKKMSEKRYDAIMPPSMPENLNFDIRGEVLLVKGKSPFP